MRAKEFSPGSQDLVIFDIDDTLLHTTAKIKVVKDGQIIRDLTNQEFNNYQLQPGEEFDFGEFRSAEKFRQESKPIEPMLRKLKTILAHAGNAKVIMLTARADFDDKDTFLQTFRDLGIDMSRVHVHRAGNIPGNEAPAYKKAVWVRKYLDTKQYGHVRLYDDSMSNLRVFKELQQEYPTVDFRAVYVGPGGTTQTVEENFADGRNPQDKGDSKRHGVPTKASVSTLRKVAKQGGRKGQLAHWMANMKAGKAKKK
jgi:FMN phosphatase YigB (HAD superfamily)